MTFDTEPAPVLWITGLAGVGKSTLARALQQRLLQSDGVAPRVLDGDSLRALLDSPADQQRHDVEARLRRAWRIARLADQYARSGEPVIVATISLLHSVQRWNRQRNPTYAEVWLRAPLEALRRQRPALYATTDGGVAPCVWGVDLIPQYPERAECILEQQYTDACLTAHVRACVGVWQRLAVENVVCENVV